MPNNGGRLVRRSFILILVLLTKAQECHKCYTYGPLVGETTENKFFDCAPIPAVEFEVW